MAELGITQKDVDAIKSDSEFYQWKASFQPNNLVIDISSLQRWSDDPQLAQQQGEMTSLLSGLKSRIEAFSTKMVLEEIRLLETQHDAAYQSCRDIKDGINNAMDEISQAQSHASNLDAECRNQHFALKAVVNNEPDPSQYPTKKEISDWQKEVATQQNKLAVAQKNLGRANQHLASVTNRQFDRRERFRAAQQQEKTLSAKLALLRGEKSSKTHSHHGMSF